MMQLYLDHNATTPVAPQVLEEMIPVFSEAFGNPGSSYHGPGRQAKVLVDQARERVAEAFSASPSRIVFTSGSTEAINLSVKGLTIGSRKRVLVGATEHKAVLQAVYDRSDVSMEKIPVLGDGRLDLDALSELLDGSVALVAVMSVNNETGVINDFDAVAQLARSQGALTLCDATQAVGRVDLTSVAGADMIALSAHKIYGPKGSGCLVTNREAHSSLKAVLSGGGQERGLRSGTLNTPGIVGLGRAVQLVVEERVCESKRQERLRDRLCEETSRRLTGVHLNGAGSERVCNTANLRFDGADGEAILANLMRVAASTGSACQSAVPEPSHVLLAMGLSSAEAEQSLRFSIGRGTSDQDISDAVDDIVQAVTRIRALEAA